MAYRPTTIYVTPRGGATTCPYRAIIIAEFERQRVSLPLRPAAGTPPAPTATMPPMPPSAAIATEARV